MRKARELLAFLAVHPDGASGEAISEALWPEADPGRAAGQRNLALRKAREMLRTATGLPDRCGSSTPPAATASTPP